MSPLEGVAVLASVTFAASVAWVVAPPPRRLAGRVRPYLVTEEPEFGRGVTASGVTEGRAVVRLLAPMVVALSRRLGVWGGALSAESRARRLRQSRLYPQTSPEDLLLTHRVDQLIRAGATGLIVGGLGIVLGVPPLGVGLFIVSGMTATILLRASRVDRAIKTRRERMRAELYTVNQLLALRTRAGGGVATALRHLTSRGDGEVVGELKEVLRLHATGWPLREALDRGAELTPEPEASRLYRLLATVQDRGGDVADALLDLAGELRQARRGALKERAAKRRLLLVIPIVVVLAPVVLLFVAAPLPRVIFGG